MCFPGDGRQRHHEVVVEMTAAEIRKFITDIDGLRDLRIRLRRLLVQVDAAEARDRMQALNPPPPR